MIDLKASIKPDLKKLAMTFENERQAEKKAFETALKVEGFRLRKVLADEVRKGAPGGRAFKPRSYISRAIKRPTAKPLSRLASVVRYHVIRKKDPEIHVGWTGPQISAAWMDIAEKQQKGFTQRVTHDQRLFFLKKSYRAVRASTRAGSAFMVDHRFAKYLRLKPSTTTLATPPRPIIDPFWRSHQDEAWRNIRSNYRKKLAGERI